MDKQIEERCIKFVNKYQDIWAQNEAIRISCVLHLIHLWENYLIHSSTFVECAKILGK